MAKSLEQRLAAIVRGQVRSYMHDHPEMFAAKVRDKATPCARHMVNGLAKRIVPDLLTVLVPCGQEQGGMVAPFPAKPPAAPDEVVPAAAQPGKDPAGVELDAAPAGRRSWLERFWNGCLIMRLTWRE